MEVRNELNRRLYEQKMDQDTFPRYNAEYTRYAAICQGDGEKAALAAEEGWAFLLHNPRLLSNNSMQNLCYSFVIEATMLAQICMENGLSHDEAYTISDIYIRKLDSCATSVEIEKNFKQMCLAFCGAQRQLVR